MIFGEKLKQLRLNKGYSQENLAELMNVSRQAITKWENGNGMPDIENLKTIARVFEVTIDSLVLEEEEVEITADGFCWKVAFAGLLIGLALGFLYNDANTSIGEWGISGGLIGYALGYILLLIKCKK